ncbi:unnamed protein product [Boreogadus saida]
MGGTVSCCMSPRETPKIHRREAELRMPPSPPRRRWTSARTPGRTCSTSATASCRRGLTGERKVAGSIPGSSQLSVEVSLRARRLTLTAPDELAFALRG